MPVTLRWLGQAGVVVDAPGARLVIDPFLSPAPGRLTAPPVAPADLAGVDAVLVTHEHDDHLDVPALTALLAASPRPRVVLPAPIVEQAAAAGLDRARLHGVQPGDEVAVGAATVVALPARHGVHVADAYTFGEELSGGAVRYLGYVVRAGGHVVHHAGDTILFEGLAAGVRELGADVTLLPINGRSPERERQDLVGNLDHREAAQLVADVGAAAVVPLHHDMFAANRGPVGAFVDALARLAPAASALVPAPGATLALAPPAS